jgi:hypothetical protein
VPKCAALISSALSHGPGCNCCSRGHTQYHNNDQIQRKCSLLARHTTVSIDEETCRGAA